VVVAWLRRSLHLNPTFWELFARHQWTVKSQKCQDCKPSYSLYI